METMPEDGACDLVSSDAVREASNEHHAIAAHHSSGHSEPHASNDGSASIDEFSLEKCNRQERRTHDVRSDDEMSTRHVHEHEHAGSSGECDEQPSRENEKHLHDINHPGSSHDNVNTCMQHARHDHDGQHKDVPHDSGESPPVKHEQECDEQPSRENEKHLHDINHPGSSHDNVNTCMQHARHVHDGQHKDVPHDSGESPPVKHEQECHSLQSNRADATHSHSGEHDKSGQRQEQTMEMHGKHARPCESNNQPKTTSSDDYSSRSRIQLNRRSTPDIDPSTQRMRYVTFNSRKLSRASMKATGNSDLDPSTSDGNLEIPSKTWAFSVRASIVPSKFDHMATLKAMYSSYKECNNGKEGVSLSRLPEILESARFMVPPPRDLVSHLQRIDIGYKSGDLVRWTLLQSLAMQIERKEARYPSVFNPRFSSYAMCNVVRANSVSPNSGKMLQRSPSRRTHPEDASPEMEPEVYQMMKQIDNHRRKSAKEGNYLAADAAAQRLLELKIFQDSKRRSTMLERHAEEREQAEKAYKEEIQERNQLWDERLKSFQKEVMDQAQRLKQQHSAAIQLFREKMTLKTPAKAQWSRELLKQRQIQAYLGKQGKYLEAQEMKRSADRMQQAELQAAIAAFQADVVSKEQSLRLKQQTEMDVLLQRAARTREEIRKNRTLDLQRSHQRHKNVMRELAAIQKQEVYRFDQLMEKKVYNPKTGIGLKTQRNSYYSLRGLTKSPDYSTDDAIYSGGED